MMNVIGENINTDGEPSGSTPFGYDRLFPNLPLYEPAKDDLIKLGRSMLDPINKLSTSKIPSGYTYLGQFIDHEITSTKIPPNIDPVEIPSISNLRTPFFDLESLYGDGSPTNCEIYQSKTLLKLDDTLGVGTGGVKASFQNDLPRKTDSAIACLIDERDDENLAIAQMHVAFIKFHNAVVKSLGDDNSDSVLEHAKEIVIRHYQWLVLHDYLPKILNEKVGKEFLTRQNQFYFPDKDNPKIPIEFSAAAFRLGHSMVRPFYQWNKIFRDPLLGGGTSHAATISDLMDLTGRGGLKSGLNPRLDLVSHWLIDWRRFFNFQGAATLNEEQRNFAAKIDTRMSWGLGSLPISPPELPVKNLLTGRRLRLPKGQDVAERMNIQPLSEVEIAGLLPEDLKNIFAKETPLWFYILAESQIRENGESLGEVGSLIVAEVFKGLIEVSPISIIREKTWKPTLGQIKPDEFGMTDMLEFVAAQTKDYDELNPIGN